MTNFVDLKGQVLRSVEVRDDKALVTLTAESGKVYEMMHIQDCCEEVLVEDIVGDLSDVIGSPILLAEEVTQSSEDGGEEPPTPEDRYRDESWTWTFYKLATIKGSVTIRWYGTSNGYYSESVDFSEVTNITPDTPAEGK